MNTDKEAFLTRNDAAAKRYKKQFYETRMDRLSDSMKRASNESELNRYKNLRNGTLDKVGKYRGKTYNS